MTFCEKARAASYQQLELQPEVINIVHDQNVSVVAIDQEDIVHIKFGELVTVFFDMQTVLNTENMEAAIHSVSLGIKGRSSWTLVVYNITNGVEVSEVSDYQYVASPRLLHKASLWTEPDFADAAAERGERNLQSLLLQALVAPPPS